MKYQGIKIPKCNGRPQLWSRGIQEHESLRIIMPDGRVDWEAWVGQNETFLDYANTTLDNWAKKGPLSDMYACTAALTQLQAIKNCIDFDMKSGVNGLFLGYL